MKKLSNLLQVSQALAQLGKAILELGMAVLWHRFKQCALALAICALFIFAIHSCAPEPARATGIGIMAARG